MEGLEAGHVSTLTPYLAVFLLTSKRGRAEQSSCAWEVCESGNGCERELGWTAELFILQEREKENFPQLSYQHIELQVSQRQAVGFWPSVISEQLER